jgi:CubicO group peptidase (beta-lactamase class C family)
VIGLLALAPLVVLLAFYPAEYARRVLFWGDSDVGDVSRFPSRAIAASPAPFRFAQRPDEARIRRVFAEAAGVGDLDAFLGGNGTQAFIVVHDDAVVYERYFNGAARDTVVTSFSVAKSFLSALIGIAIAERRIGGVDDPITAYLPELAARDGRFARITLRHLLTMASGLRYRELRFFNGDDAKTYYWPDLRRLALEQTRIEGPPGRRFLYDNYHPLLLGLVLERVTGMPVATYLQERLWQPIGMEYPASWSLDSEASGFEKLESGLNARAIDFAKFGRLYLRDGDWDGRRVIPADWVAASTREEATVDRTRYEGGGPITPAGPAYYGYFWWGRRRADGGYDFSARGNHGQIIYVSPPARLIVVRNGERYGIEPAAWSRVLAAAAAAMTPPR